MARLVAFLSNDPSRIRCAFHPFRDILVAGAADNHDGWGLGYFQASEVLLQKRPKGKGVEVRAAEIVKSLRTDAFILHVREATVGSWKHDNTHPFRFRSWLMAHRGTVERFTAVKRAMTDQIPEYLRRNIRGESDSEYLFHLFLSRLHDEGKLDDVNLDPRHLAGVLAATVAQTDEISRRAGATEQFKANIALMNGRVLVASRRGLPMHFVRREGIEDCEACRAQQEVAGGRAPRVAHPHFRFVLLTTDLKNPPAEWREVADSSVLIVDRDLEVSSAPLAL